MGFFGDMFKPKAQPEADADRSAKMMEKLKARRGVETGKWLALMDSGKAPPPPGAPPTIEDLDQREVLEEVPYVPPFETQFADPELEDNSHALSAENQTVEGVQMLFSEFQNQANQYNSVVEEIDLQLMVQAPELISDGQDESGQIFESVRKTGVFKGHVVLQHWAMLVQGYEQSIDVYFIAADEILNFTLNNIRESGLEPFLKIASSDVNGRRIWKIDGITIHMGTIPLLCQELLGDLIRIATGTMSEGELFANKITALRLGETVAKGYSAPEREEA